MSKSSKLSNYESGPASINNNNNNNAVSANSFLSANGSIANLGLHDLMSSMASNYVLKPSAGRDVSHWKSPYGLVKVLWFPIAPINDATERLLHRTILHEDNFSALDIDAIESIITRVEGATLLGNFVCASIDDDIIIPFLNLSVFRSEKELSHIITKQNLYGFATLSLHPSKLGLTRYYDAKVTKTNNKSEIQLPKRSICGNNLPSNLAPYYQHRFHSNQPSVSWNVTAVNYMVHLTPAFFLDPLPADMCKRKTRTIINADGYTSRVRKIQVTIPSIYFKDESIKYKFDIDGEEIPTFVSLAKFDPHCLPEIFSHLCHIGPGFTDRMMLWTAEQFLEIVEYSIRGITSMYLSNHYKYPVFHDNHNVPIFPSFQSPLFVIDALERDFPAGIYAIHSGLAADYYMVRASNITINPEVTLLDPNAIILKNSVILPRAKNLRAATIYAVVNGNVTDVNNCYLPTSGDTYSTSMLLSLNDNHVAPSPLIEVPLFSQYADIIGVFRTRTFVRWNISRLRLSKLSGYSGDNLFSLGLPYSVIMIIISFIGGITVDGDLADAVPSRFGDHQLILRFAGKFNQSITSSYSM